MPAETICHSKQWYKIVFTINGSWSFTLFHFVSEAEKKKKLEAWKLEHVTPYNKVDVLWHGLDN